MKKRYLRIFCCQWQWRWGWYGLKSGEGEFEPCASLYLSLKDIHLMNFKGVRLYDLFFFMAFSWRWFFICDLRVVTDCKRKCHWLHLKGLFPHVSHQQTGHYCINLFHHVCFGWLKSENVLCFNRYLCCSFPHYLHMLPYVTYRYRGEFWHQRI